MKKVAIIIPSTPKKALFELLRSLQGQLYKQLIVQLEGTTPGEKRNLGVSLKNDDIELLCFLDDDLILKDNFIEQGIKQFELGNYDFAQSKVIGGVENAKNKFTSTACWFTVKAFFDVDGFDEKFRFNEDIDIYQRALQKGFNYGYLDKSIAWHPEIGMYENLIASNKRLEVKHPSLYKQLKKEIR